jgi:hypothetical protein
MPPVSKQNAYVLFCDDVRQEVGGKKTLVGVYGTVLYVPAFPTLIPKFYAITTLICDSTKIPRQLTIRLDYGKEEIAKADLTSEDLQEFITEADKEAAEERGQFPESDPSKIRLTVEIMVSPFVIREGRRLASHVETEHGSVRAGSLVVVQQDGVESTGLPWE